MTNYHLVVTTKNEMLMEHIFHKFQGREYAKELTLVRHESPDDPAAEPGEYILYYMSNTHHKLRYYVGPPKKLGEGPQWTYKKKEATKLSQEACTALKERLAKMNYNAPMKVSKGGADLTVVKGAFGQKAYRDVMQEKVGDTETDKDDR